MNTYDIFRILSFIVTLYSYIITVRIILSWFANGLHFPMRQYLDRITDPYLNIFRRIPGLRIGFLDFSVLIGLYALSFLATLFRAWALYGIGLNTTLIVLARTLFVGASSVFGFIAFIALIRMVGLFLKANSIGELWYRLDYFLQPMVHRLTRFISPHRSLPYGSALALFIASCFLVSMALRLILVPLSHVIGRIPF